MDKIAEMVLKHHSLEGKKVFFHGTKPRVADELANGEMEVNSVFHVTDNAEVACAYAGREGKVLVIVSDDYYGQRSAISLCQTKWVNGNTQWVMSSEEANEMLDNAAYVGSSKAKIFLDALYA